MAAASAGDVINVAAGTYAETVTIGKLLTLNGAGAATTIIDASGLSWGVYVDGIDNPNLAGVVVSGLTIQNAKFEGILVANASYVTIADNIVTGNNTGLTIDAKGKVSCPGIPAFETNEGQDCGEGIHLEGADHGRVLNNVVRNNAGGILITDDTGATFENVIAGNKVIDNVSDCGITLASHVAAAMTGSAAPLGVYHNTVSGNVSSGNGTKTGEGAGVGIFASAPKTANYGNVVINNQLTGNGIPGVAIHGHAPGQNLNNNVIVGNQISGNGPDVGDPGPTGIHVSSVVPVLGLVISDNTISGETVSIAVAAAGEARVQRNSLSGRIGIDNMGTAAIYADYNWWGCNGNPTYPVSSLFAGCSLTAGNVTVNNWLPAAPPQ
ncbi:MAG: right-handed parallel beta-helix repeat-containing protein [Acidobacteria bacterium]|nr:right-handed parallel beta-helix repeat-containing protein [Acidobacteriota bacterium]